MADSFANLLQPFLTQKKNSSNKKRTWEHPHPKSVTFTFSVPL